MLSLLLRDRHSAFHPVSTRWLADLDVSPETLEQGNRLTGALVTRLGVLEKTEFAWPHINDPINDPSSPPTTPLQTTRAPQTPRTLQKPQCAHSPRRLRRVRCAGSRRDSHCGFILSCAVMPYPQAMSTCMCCCAMLHRAPHQARLRVLPGSDATAAVRCSPFQTHGSHTRCPSSACDSVQHLSHPVSIQPL